MTMSSTELTTELEKQALERRQKLMRLKRKREGKDDTNTDNAQNDELQALPKPLFRSYRPSDEKLRENVIPGINPENIEPQVKDQIESSKVPIVMNELDVTTLAPRKPDWDLKRDIANKMNILEKQTQKAIAELIRERLKAKKADLASLVNVRSENLDQE